MGENDRGWLTESERTMVAVLTLLWPGLSHDAWLRWAVASPWGGNPRAGKVVAVAHRYRRLRAAATKEGRG